MTDKDTQTEVTTRKNATQDVKDKMNHDEKFIKMLKSANGCDSVEVMSNGKIKIAWVNF